MLLQFPIWKHIKEKKESGTTQIFINWGLLITTPNPMKKRWLNSIKL